MPITKSFLALSPQSQKGYSSSKCHNDITISNKENVISSHVSLFTNEDSPTQSLPRGVSRLSFIHRVLPSPPLGSEGNILTELQKVTP